MDRFIHSASDVSKDNNVNLHVNASVPTHGKYVHDQIVCTVKTKATYNFKEDLIPITSGCSVAGRTCTWLRSEFGAPQVDFVQRQFTEMSAADLRVANSPSSILLSHNKERMKSCHCLLADVAGNVKFRQRHCQC